MDEITPIESAPLGAASPVGLAPPPADSAPPGQSPEEERETDPRLSPTPSWRPWSAPLALVGGLVLAAVGGLIVDLPASLLFGAKVTSGYTSPGLVIVDTIVQDIGFIVAAVYCARLGVRTVRSWQFGLRRPGVGWPAAGGYVLLLLVLFVVLSVIWSGAVHPKEEELLKTLGSNEGTGLLLASAFLTCVVAPICEEFLFRGYIFTALRNWKGTLPAALITGILFGGVHVGSAPALDLVPLAALGFGLCLLYRNTGSLYPCFIAHSINNSIAFSGLEKWSWQIPLLLVGSLAGIALVVALCKRTGLIAPATRISPAEA
jgi:uncharacterized protein